LSKLNKIVYFVTRNCHQFTTPTHDTKTKTKTKKTHTHTHLFLTHLYYNITMNIPTRFGPCDIIIRESNQNNTA